MPCTPTHGLKTCPSHSLSTRTAAATEENSCLQQHNLRQRLHDRSAHSHPIICTGRQGCRRLITAADGAAVCMFTTDLIHCLYPPTPKLQCGSALAVPSPPSQSTLLASRTPSQPSSVNQVALGSMSPHASCCLPGRGKVRLAWHHSLKVSSLQLHTHQVSACPSRSCKGSTCSCPCLHALPCCTPSCRT
jgi:hypothetical protein